VKARTNRWLQGSFDLFNRKYFFGRLIAIECTYGKPVKGADAHWELRDRTIVIDKDLRTHDSLALICLLHEMAHAYLELDEYEGGTTVKDNYHGMRYQAEIWRLIQMGGYDGLL
jgi:hypothetical protein